MKLLALLLLIFVNIGSFPVENGEEQEIRTLLEERDQQIKELLGPEGTEYTDDQREQLRSIINDMMDYREMARYALAEKFNELNAEEQEEFTKLFASIIRDQSLQQLDIYRAEVEYDNIEIGENQAVVSTMAILDDNRIPVKYRMTQKDGEWIISDMSVDEAWTAESYRRSFQNIIRRRGFEALMENLRKRAEQA